MRTTLLLTTLALMTATLAVVPTADAANGCTILKGPCPGTVCYGTGSHYGYLVCVGPGYCDPAACEPWTPDPEIIDLCEYMDNCVILPDGP